MVSVKGDLMRQILVFAVLSFAGFSVAAQQQPPAKAPQQGDKPAAGAKQESNLEKRIRTEGAAGGTAPVPPEEREGVGAGAKPHVHFDQLQRGLHRRSTDEVIEPPK
jgi:hypothetical protein